MNTLSLPPPRPRIDAALSVKKAGFSPAPANKYFDPRINGGSDSACAEGLHHSYEWHGGLLLTKGDQLELYEVPDMSKDPCFADFSHEEYLEFRFGGSSPLEDL